jgi:hypothetical protein
MSNPNRMYTHSPRDLDLVQSLLFYNNRTLRPPFESISKALLDWGFYFRFS